MTGCRIAEGYSRKRLRKSTAVEVAAVCANSRNDASICADAFRTVVVTMGESRSTGDPGVFGCCLALLKLWRPSIYGVGALVALWYVGRWLEPDYGPPVRAPDGIALIKPGMSKEEVCSVCGGPPGRHASHPCVRPYYGICIWDAPPHWDEWVWDNTAVAVHFDEKERVRRVMFAEGMRLR